LVANIGDDQLAAVISYIDCKRAVFIRSGKRFAILQLYSRPHQRKAALVANPAGNGLRFNRGTITKQKKDI